MAIDLRDYLPALRAEGTNHLSRNPSPAPQQVAATSEQLAKGVRLLETALAGDRTAFGKLRQTLGSEDGLGALLDQLQAKAQADAERQLLRGARASAFAALKTIARLPLPPSLKAELGGAVLKRALAGGVIDGEERADIEAGVLSESVLHETRQALAATAEPGAAKALADSAKQQGALVPHDAALLDRLADERAPVEVHRHRARLVWKEQDDLAAYSRGELPEPLSEESFRLAHGARGALGAYVRYQEARRSAPSMAAIRGRSAEEIEIARAGWTGDAADFQRAVEKDAEARRRDPAGYALATVARLQQALDEIAEPAERQALFWAAQEDLGLPERDRSPWTLAQERALADAWDALPSGHGGRNEKLAFFEKHLLSLPPAQRPAAIVRLVRQGIVDGTETELAQLVAELEAGRVNPARRRIDNLTPASERLADSGYIASDAGAEAQRVDEPQAGMEAPTEPAPRDWRSAGIPDSQSDTDWRTPVYRPGRQDALASTLSEILAVEHEPDKLAEVEARIKEIFAGDEWAIDFFIRHARILAKAEDDDAISGDDRRTWSRDAITEARERVLAGEPYNESWAQLRSTLAQLEQATGLRFRPAGSTALVAIYQAGSDVPLFSLPLPVVEVLSEAPEALSEFIGLAGKLLRGEDISEDLEALRGKLVRISEYIGEDGEPRSSVDTSRFDEVRAAIEGARQRLAGGAAPDEVFLHLAQVFLADELDNTDLALETVKTLLEFAPYYDLVDIGINTVALFEALDAGDWEAAAAAGLSTVLATIGLVPIVGDGAKAALSWIGRHLGLLPTPVSRSLAWLTGKAARVGTRLDILEQRLRKTLEGDFNRMTRYLNGEREPFGFQWTKYRNSKAWKALPPQQQAQFKSLYGKINDLRGGIGEQEMRDLVASLPLYAGTAMPTHDVYVLVIDRAGKRHSLPLDMARLPADSPLLRDLNRRIVGTRGNPITPDRFISAGGFALEFKTGAAKLKPLQRLLRNQLLGAGNRAGRRDVWLKAHMPNHEIPLAEHISAVRNSARHYGFPEEFVETLVKEVRNNTPRTWPFVLSVAATEMLMLSIYLATEED